MGEQRRSRSRSVTDNLLVDLVTEAIDRWHAEPSPGDESATTASGSGLRITDVGGGTGTLAIRFAEAGHHVTVVDPSLDALASLQRRTAERNLSDRLQGVQGDAGDLVEVLGSQSVDVLICHRTFEVIDDPAAALRSMAEVVRPGGALSIVVAQRRAAVLSQAMQGHIAAATAALADRSRFDGDTVAALVADAGFSVTAQQGVGVVAHHVPAARIDAEPGLARHIYELERKLSTDPAFRAIAALAHIFAVRP